ncbi:Maf family protein [Psychromonas marina]|nr:Maf family protein [Psychromonas marina]
MLDPMIYLSSNSPRRAELLTQIGVSYTRVKGDVEECLQVGENAPQYVTRLALQKAQAGFLNSPQDKPVLGADTIVVSNQHILEKPRNQAHAKQMMQLLSNTTHQVFTAIALVDKTHKKQCLVTTSVTFKKLSEQEITDYWNSGEPADKAGGYGIQGLGGKFVTNISGSYSAVVGLPLYETDQLIKEFLKESPYVG